MALFGGKKIDMDDAGAVWEEFFTTAMKNDWKKALEFVKRLCELEKNNSQAFLKAGDVHQRLKNTADALEAYRISAAIMEEDAQYSKALAVYKQIMRLEPENANAKTRAKVLLDFIKDGGAVASVAADAAPAPADEGGAIEAPVASADPTAQVDEAPESPVVEQPVAAPPVAEKPATPKKPAPPKQKKPANLKEAFNRHPIFSVLSDEEIKDMSKRAKHVSFNDGDVVIAEDTQGDSIYIIKKGKAEVTSSVMGDTIRLANLGGLAFFGEGGFLTGADRSATVTARGALELMEIERPLMSDMVSGNPKLLGKLIEMLRSRSGKKE